MSNQDFKPCSREKCQSPIDTAEPKYYIFINAFGKNLYFCHWVCVINWWKEIHGSRSVEGVESQLNIIDRATEILKENPYENYTPIELLLHIWRFYTSQKSDDPPHYFDDKFQSLMKNVENYLRYYQEKKTVNKGFEEIKAKLRLLENTYTNESLETTVNLATDDTFQALKMDINNLFERKVEVSKWEFEKPEGKTKEARRARYRIIFEDDTLRLLLGEDDLQLVTKHDSFAYDIPLKLLRELLKVEPFTLDRTKRYQWVDDSDRTLNMMSIDSILKEFYSLIKLSESESLSDNEKTISRTTQAHSRYIFIEWLLGMQGE